MVIHPLHASYIMEHYMLSISIYYLNFMLGLYSDWLQPHLVKETSMSIFHTTDTCMLFVRQC